MRLFFGALVLNFMVFFNEIEASGLRKVSTRPYVNDREGIDHLVTFRRSPQSFSTYNNPPLQAHGQSLLTHDRPVQAHQYLDLNEPPPYSPESFDQQVHGHHFYPEQPLRQLDPAETSNLVYKYNFKNGRRPDPKDYQEPKYSQEYSNLGNVKWLVGETREAELDALYEKHMDEVMSTQEHDGSMRSHKTLFKNQQRFAKQLKEQEMIQEEQEKKPRELRFRETNPSQNTGEASRMNPHVTGESGSRGKGKAPSRKGVSDSRFKAEAAGRRNVLDSHDPFIHQSQSSEHHFQNPYPVSIPSRMSAFYPYIRHPPNDPNDPQHWNYPGGSGSNYKK